jgi:alpha-mannosidase
MQRLPLILLLSGCLSLAYPVHAADSAPAAPGFLRLVPLPVARIIGSATAYPGGSFEASHLVDGNPGTEYSSDSKGTNTFVEVEFAAPVKITAFRHVDRNDPATVSSSEVTLKDATGQTVGTFAVAHANRRAGETFFTLPAPVVAQRAHWRVSGLGPQRHGTVGGAELVFYTSGVPEAAPAGLTVEAKPLRMLERRGAAVLQPIRVTLDYPYAAPLTARVRVAGAEPAPLTLKFGRQVLELAVPPATAERPLQIEVEALGRVVAAQTVPLKPVRPLDIYLLPHSHVDIGYTALQADVETKQNSNIETGLRLIQATKDFPEGARFKWNVEVLWPVDNYLRAATPEKRAAFFAAVRAGQVGLDALYGNILTGLCRPEELIRLTTYATRLAGASGVPIQSAMISDVPGYTWSTVSALAQAGVRYFSFAPNYFDRMGGTMVSWQNKPFWWKGADGQSRVLCWCPSRGYALGHLIGDGPALTRFLPDYLVELETNSYPYDITHLRWNVHGDNGSPDEKVAEVVRDWNLRYASPRLIIATTAEAFRAFEAFYGARLPEFSGDYTPYWEDGAASSAQETALNRASAERLVQAETLWALRQPRAFPVNSFFEAWRNVLLYSEHTWGAHNSISQPDIPFVRDQWKVKQAFALDADRGSRRLLAGAWQAGAPPAGAAPSPGSALPVDVFNTASWERTDWVTLSADLARTGHRVTDDQGHDVPSQRLSTGELLFLARAVPALSGRGFRVLPSAAPAAPPAVRAEGATLVHPDFTLRLDERTGGIASFFSRSLNRELVDSRAPTALNDYFYLPGSDLKDLKRNGAPRISVKENGPLVASLLVESEAPGCKRLAREVRVVDGLERVEIIDLVDKLPVREKEGVHFGFGFNVPDGVVRMDVGWAVVRPEVDQIPAACKNWFSVQRWVDISNDRFGVTVAPVDAPLVQVGGISANLVGSQTDHRVWIQHQKASQTLYWWVMNNHWHTNYRADQEGPVTFRFFLHPHRAYAPEQAARFGVECAQPLLALSGRDAAAARPAPPFEISSDRVLVTAFKPSDDGKAWIVRLFDASGQAETVKLSWAKPAPRRLWLSDTSERPLREARESVTVPGWGVVTLRAELP